MAADEFFNRWSKTKSKTGSESAEQLASPALAVDNDTRLAAEPQPLPQMHDVEQLHEESDFSVFMCDGVDESVRRSAMKKLFANPHFNVMDGLDIYVADYSQPDPLPPGMLASLRHAEILLNPLRQLAQPLQNLLQRVLDPSPDPINLDSLILPDLSVSVATLQEIKTEDEFATKTDVPHLANTNDEDPIQV